MLEDLPVEVLQQVIGHLPTVSAITNFSLVSKKLHAIVDKDESASYRPFVRRAFPSIKAPPEWRQVAAILTSRARAWDRRALLARECCPPDSHSASRDTGQRNRTVFGFAPAIDSYEDFTRNSITGRQEVVAWGAAGRINIRVTNSESLSWRTLKFDDDHLPSNDILQLKLLRPHQRSSSEQALVYRRANDEIATIETTGESPGYCQYARFVDTASSECIEVNNATEPLLAVARTGRLQLYSVQDQQDVISASEIITLEEANARRHRTRCMRFLNHGTIAVGTAFLEGHDNGPVRVYDLTAPVTRGAAVPIWSCTPTSSIRVRARYNAHALAGLDHVCGNGGQLFLSGWSSGKARLHDTRTPDPWVAEYSDTVDNGQILSLAAIGHERFLAGSDQNACLKTFDLRMPGDHTYSYLDARPSASPKRRSSASQNLVVRPHADRRSFNTFLSVRKWRNERVWDPLPLPRQHSGTTNYSGSIYGLSVPSPTSPTVYAGIENHVLQLDFVGTDDVERGYIDPLLSNLKEQKNTHVFDLGCYERPRPGRESTDPVLLNKQAMWHELKSQPERNEESEASGWDRRWRLGGMRRPSWSRGRNTGRGGRRGSTGQR